MTNATVSTRLGWVPISLALALPIAISGCSGGTAGDRANRGAFKVNQITTGLGQVFPYRIRQLDAFGNPTTTVLNIEDIEILKANVNANNGVLPVATLPTTAVLPNGQPGNQFLLLRFSHKLRVESILSDQIASSTNSGLTTAVSLVAYDPATESTEVVRGRGFVGGITYYNEGGRLVRREAVRINNGAVQIVDARANGFPRGFNGDTDLVEPSSFVFIPDVDNDLATFERYPDTRLIRIVVTNAVRDSDGKVLAQEVSTATTVGPDTNPPQVLGYTKPTPEITPGNNQTNVDPTTSVLVRFNKPVQPGDVGAFFAANNLIPATGGITLSVTAAAQTFSVLYYADPLSYGDLTNYRIRPSYTLPGQSTVTVRVNTTIRGLIGAPLGQVVQTPFTTGDGPGIVNAPVAPDAVYVGIGGSAPGVSVIDLNGLGQGTGDPVLSGFHRNPNVGAPGVLPVLSRGTGPLDAGSAGALTLVQDTAGNTRLLRPPVVGQVGDIHIGAPLDLVFNNENINRNASRANQVDAFAVQVVGNTITTPPDPNPPKLVFPPPNPARQIFGEEPSVTSSTGAPGTIFTGGPPAGCIVSPVNGLKTGNPFSTQSTSVGIFGHYMEGVFYGPQPPPPSPPPPMPFCPFTSRQQVGHFLYVLDRDNDQVLVVNSNRFTVLDTIRLTDPFSMGMSPDLKVLGVTNFSSSTVSFVDIDPTSPNFHTVIGTTRVEAGPTQIAWQPENEDIFVVSPGSNAVTILQARDFAVRRTVAGFLNNPIDVAVTPRPFNWGYNSQVYYAYILNANGTVAVYESGPDGVNGIGFNDVIGIVSNAQFRRPRTIKLEYTSSQQAVFVAHTDENGLGQISRLELTASLIGPQPISPNSGGFILPPTFRQKEWTVVQRFGGQNPTTPVRDLLSGNAPVDVTFDEMYNFGALLGYGTPSSFPADPSWLHSGKHAVKNSGGAPLLPLRPKLLFVALADSGKVDILDYGTGRKLRTLDVPGVTTVATYWRQ